MTDTEREIKSERLAETPQAFIYLPVRGK